MGLFRRWRSKKEYTLAEAIELLKREEYSDYMPVPTSSGTYWLRKQEREEGRQPTGVTDSISRTEENSSSVFDQRRNKFMSEVNGDGEYENISYDISGTHSERPGRVVPSYNREQSR